MSNAFTIAVGMSTCNMAAGSNDLLATLNAADVGDVGIMGCLGMCHAEPQIRVTASDGSTYLYHSVNPPKLNKIIDQHLRGGEPVTAWLFDESTGNGAALMGKQQRVVLRNCGLIDPENIDDYIARDGYEALKQVLQQSDPAETCETILAAGLRGRGGAGFPTGLKWKFALAEERDKKYVVCNADEGDPGAFMDRSTLESDPHAVLEGMAIQAFATGANEGYIYCRAEYPLAVARLKIAIAQAEERGYLGDRIFDTDFSLELHVKEGAGAFVCGEETALMASIEGERGMPRLRPPFPAQSGLFGKPTTINNVETLASVPWIIRQGAEAYAAIGTDKSKGTKVFALAGKIKRGGLVEVPMGITIRDVVEEVGGGTGTKRNVKAVQMGGPSGGCVPDALLDTLIDYDEVNKTGAIMGSGGMIVLDDTTCMVDVARYFLDFTQLESCGKCTFCRIGTRRMLEILTRICEGKGVPADIPALEELAVQIKDTSLCGLGQTAPNPVLTTLRYFREEYEEHINEGKCRAGKCVNLCGYDITDACTGCTACARKCPVDAITGTKGDLHTIDLDTCVRCGVCRDVCNFDAVKVVLVMSEVKFTLNGASATAKQGDTILDAAKAADYFIPTFCHNDELKPFASCFVCAVEVEGRRTLVPSCSTEVTEGMVVNTENERVKGARKTCLDLLLSDHVGDCLGPCMTSCPAGIDIPGFVNHIAKGRDEEALKLINNNMPLAGSLGRVCTRPCEEGCRRQLVEQPVAICQLKRFPADQAKKNGWDVLPTKRPSIGKKVAVVGAGPAGLSAAYYLQLFGIDCVVIDAHEAPGGMIRYGIPSYRLPRTVIDEEAAVIEQLGAEFRYNTKLGVDVSLDELRAEYDAVFLALGAQKASGMRTPGEELEGVRSGIDFLGAVSRDETLPIGDQVVVVGGGNTAIDAARTALRMGAKDVSILYRRAREQMPAWAEEIDAALDEGVRLETLAAPVKIETTAKGLALTSVRMELGEPDDSGRRRPVPVEGSEYTVEVDEIIAAIGQNVDSSMVDALDLTPWGSINAHEETGVTSIEGVFAGGDAVTGADIAVNAVAAGRRGAFAIDQYLRGEDVVGDPGQYNHSMGTMGQIPAAVTEPFAEEQRVPMPHLDAKKRATNFEEVETGFTEEMARAEAARCMECGCRDAHECSLRGFATMFGASSDRFAGDQRAYRRDDSHAVLVYEEHKCIQCGTCVRVCDELLDSPCVGFVGRGFDARVKPALDRKLSLINNDELPRLADYCPVGALTLKSDPVATLEPTGFLKEDA